MTPPPSSPLPPDPDELASAIVDGLLPPAEAEQARRDPAVARRVDEILRLRAAVRAVGPPPSGTREAAMAAALAAFDEGEAAPADADHGEAGDSPPLRVVATSHGVARPAPPSPGRGADSARSGTRPTAGRWLAAAAAILVVGLVAAGLVGQRDGDGDGDTAAVEESAEEPTGSADQSTADPSVAAEDTGDDAAHPQADEFGEQEAGGAAGSAGAPYLGQVESAGQLAERVEDNLELGSGAARVPAATPEVGAPDASTCPALAATGDPVRGAATFFANADYQGEPVVVHLYEADEEARLVATNHSCVDVVDVPFRR